jgi:DNA replication and repair protein RecF
VEDLRPYVASAYAEVARGASATEATMSYKASLELPADHADRDALAAALLAEVERRRDDEIDRGLSLVGPHRDDLVLSLGPLPVRGYASHGESWSMALALRLASYQLLRSTGDDPILILDDVFAELDTDRRDRLAGLVADAEQVLVTAAVPDDIPAALAGVRIDVVDGKVLPGVR